MLLPPQPETWVVIDPEPAYLLENAQMRTRCGWTPFAGMRVFGRLLRVLLRGEPVYENGELLAKPGTGKVLFQAGE